LTKIKVNKLTNLLSILAVLASFSVHGQEAPNPESHDLVMYDPLFWKSELSLKTNQSRKIEAINNEFYESIRTMKANEDTREANNERLERGLQQRSQKIFDTLLPRQKKKLEKIIDRTAPVTAP
jgi:hypothetical protein